MASNLKDKETSSALPIGIIVFGLTALGYAVAYIFQLSYLRFFGINYKLIDISPQSIVIAVLMTFLAYFTVTMWLKPVLSVSRTLEKSAVGTIWAKYITTGTILTVIIFSFLAGIGMSLISSALWAICIVLFFVIATNIEAIIWIIRRKNVHKGFVDFHEDVAKMYERQGDTYIDTYAEYIMIAVLVLSLGFFSGRQFAIIDSTHLPVIEQEARYIKLIIQRSGNMIVTKDYDEKNHKLIDGYSLMNIDGSQPLNISHKINISQK